MIADFGDAEEGGEPQEFDSLVVRVSEKRQVLQQNGVDAVNLVVRPSQAVERRSGDNNLNHPGTSPPTGTARNQRLLHVFLRTGHSQDQKLLTPHMHFDAEKVTSL